MASSDLTKRLAQSMFKPKQSVVKDIMYVQQKRLEQGSKYSTSDIWPMDKYWNGTAAALTAVSTIWALKLCADMVLGRGKKEGF